MLIKDPKNISIVNKRYNLIKDVISLINDSDNSALILNVCNNMNTFGAGFNKSIANAFPLAKENYHLLGPSKLKQALGYTQFVTVKTNPKYRNNIVVANMICQTGIISEKNPRPLNYYFLSSCLSKVQNFIKQYNSDNETKIQVYCPKYHQHTLGANWSFIYELLSDTLKKPIFIQVYETY